MCSMRERSGEAVGQGSMSIPFTLLRVLRTTCGRTLSCWNNEPEAACTNCRTKAKTIWLTYRPIVKPKVMCRRAALCSNMMALQTIIPLAYKGCPLLSPWKLRYSPIAFILPWTKTGFVREQCPIPFVSSVDIVTTSSQTCAPIVERLMEPWRLGCPARTLTSCKFSRMV